MQIFAKRKKKLTTPINPGGDDHTIINDGDSSHHHKYQPDPAIEELLKKDPAELNSKQRRLVKRYQQRKQDCNDDGEESNVNIEETGIMKVNKNECDDQAEENSQKDQEQTEPSSDISNLPIEEDGRHEQPGPKRQKIDLGSAATHDANENLDRMKIKNADKSEKVDPEDPIWELLGQLNSKAKRTLTRKLEREGIASLADVKSEAQEILSPPPPPPPPPEGTASQERTNDTAQISESTTAAVANATSPLVTTKKRNRRGKIVDWESLPPEERLRREEQRRMQQEAAERRARGEVSMTHKHALNSERRRANRRKPKWDRTRPQQEDDYSYKNEHHTSGYMHRKNALRA